MAIKNATHRIAPVLQGWTGCTHPIINKGNARNMIPYHACTAHVYGGILRRICSIALSAVGFPLMFTRDENRISQSRLAPPIPVGRYHGIAAIGYLAFARYRWVRRLSIHIRV
ncbi:hypothetical protein F4679DRAFT_519502 [Xylaria curta]|nr:hypothetical protein F4679DRAFT_519502 [Xylaria curta]